ncbi:hypothetical protein [Dictyobacter aurantiacus]|uniref:Uncharacterized protein n=1 Tax=Dictyobacter aurantiacus TaxID=1936993 RepID=A0A401ZFG1_9CHLR|nr:hypothetical protein [Dictyobacter aurantiacus]GCE05533.1 hypothetical protein KDAU_28620 [Dictyobacter aurantiacus]
MAATTMVLAVDPILAMLGQIAALVICLFALVFIVITVVFNLAMGFAMSFLEEKVQLIKMLRPFVDSVNTTSKAAEHGIAPPKDKPAPARIAGQLPLRVNQADKTVDQVSDRVANAVIEFRARTIQAKAMAKAFFLPGLMNREERTTIDGETIVNERGQQFTSPGYRTLVSERPEVLPGHGPQSEAPVQEQIVRQRR